MTINTLDGDFEFKVQRFILDEDGQERQVDYFELTNQFQAGYFSDRLKEFAAYYSNRLSYEDNEKLIVPVNFPVINKACYITAKNIHP